MNDITTPAAPLPSNSSVIQGATAPIASMTPDQVTAEFQTIQAQLAGNVSPHARAPLLARQMALAEARWPSDASPGLLPSGELQYQDPRDDPAFAKEMAAPEHSKERANAVAALAKFEQARDASEMPVTQAELQQMDDMQVPTDPREYQFRDAAPDQAGKVAAAQRLLFDNGVSPQVANLLLTTGDSLAALDDDAFSARTQDAAKIVKALPGGAKMVQDAHAFLTGLPDDHPLLSAAIMATATEVGIRELARLQRRKAAGK